MTTIQEFIKQEIHSLLNNLSSLFPGGELAYYSLQGKNENQIRDKIAWKLQRKIDMEYGKNKFIARREWGLKKEGRSKFDLAVLRVGDNLDKSNLIALFEFKAHHFVNKETWPFQAFKNDVKKMCDHCKRENNADVDMYFILLHSTQSHKTIKSEFKEAIAYREFLTRRSTLVSTDPNNDKPIKDAVSIYWSKFFKSNNDSPKIADLIIPSSIL